MCRPAPAGRGWCANTPARSACCCSPENSKPLRDPRSSAHMNVFRLRTELAARLRLCAWIDRDCVAHAANRIRLDTRPARAIGVLPARQPAITRDALRAVVDPEHVGPLLHLRIEIADQQQR